MTSSAEGAAPPRQPAPAPPATPGPLVRELRAVHALVLRDLLRMLAQPIQTALMLVQPLLFLLLLGGGLAALVPATAVGGDYRTYLFPGVLLMTVQTPAVTVGMRLITDRESGHLRETLMAPVRRSTLLYGSCLGGTTEATVQGAVLLATAGTVGLPYHPVLLLSLLATVALASFVLTALAAALAIGIRSVESFHVLLSLALMPLLFLSGAFFPLTALPGWLAQLTAVNPLSYAVDVLRRSIAQHVPGTPAATTVHWGNWQVPAALEIVTLVLLGASALLWAAHRFGRLE
ncbi:ABC transporter permease [Streptomyces purpurogeneiscleroticus]|uniref:ABC transporter permease n=1 Tax=Streptomyces purpurogeneiscleroticus TaxID=68259 RepID=UPI001CBBF0A5|nr:ABC transporter [Streptomyces purpurogeneiscleroticus]